MFGWPVSPINGSLTAQIPCFQRSFLQILFFKEAFGERIHHSLSCNLINSENLVVNMLINVNILHFPRIRTERCGKTS